MWELYALVEGRLPLKSEFGKPFSTQSRGGYVGGEWGRTHKVCLMQLKADNAWYVEGLGLRPWNSLVHMCPWCRASRDGFSTWKDFSFRAAWLGQCRGHVEFVQDMRDSEGGGFGHGLPFSFRPVLTQAPYFSWDMVMLDWMHCADLGIIGYELGEILWTILPRLAPVRTRYWMVNRQRGLQVLKARLARYYANNRQKTRLPLRRLTLRKIKVKRHPKLKAKAAQARGLVPFVEELAKEFCGVDGQLGEDPFKCIWHLARICELASRRELTAEELLQWRVLATHHMFVYTKCGFRTYPKHHFFMHLAAQVHRCGVPRTFWNYADESKNSRFKRLFREVNKGWSVEQLILLRESWYHLLKRLRMIKEQIVKDLSA